MSKLDKNAETVRKVKISLLKETIKWKEAFATEDGKKCLELLKEEFYDIPIICDSNPEVTKRRAAQRDLVRQIIDKLNYTGE